MNPSPRDEEGYQAALLEALFAAREGTDAETVRDALLADPRCRGFEEDVAAMEPRMLALACTLVRTWTRRDDEANARDLRGR